MPRNVRNFWIELDVDGKETTVATGPRSKDGGFSLAILVRHNGGVERVLRIDGRALSDGRLIVDVETEREARAFASRIDDGSTDGGIRITTAR